MSAKQKVKKVAKYLVIVWATIVLLGVLFNAIGGFVGGGSVDMKKAFGVEDKWSVFILFGPAQVNEQNNGTVNIKLPSHTDFYGPLSLLEECQDTATSMINALYEPETGSYICGLNCKENSSHHDQNCESIETEQHSQDSE